MRICIDAGHGGKDSGAIGYGGRLEKDDALRMARALSAEMAGRGHYVTLTREGDEYPSLSDRVRVANFAESDVFVSLHRNSAGADAHGAEVLYRTVTDKTPANDAKSRALAEAVQRVMVAATGFRDRGAKVQNTNTYVLQHTRMPAVTVEAGFVSSASDNARFDARFDALVRAIADGIETAFGIPLGTSIEAPSAPAPFVDGLPYSFTNPCCRPPENSERVRWVQERLHRHNALPGGKIDGVFGMNTRAGVVAFQSARVAEGRDTGGVDGIVGPKTARILAE